MTTPPVLIDTNATQLSYGVEATWGVVPPTTFTALRYTSETLSMTKTRTRPSEINSNREAIQALTTSVQAGGQIGYALSWGTHNAFLESAINNTFPALTSIAGAAADIVLTNVSPTSATLSSATAGKFTNITQGSWIRTLGFVSNGGQNNQIFYVSIKNSALLLTLTTTAPTVTETPAGTLAQIRQANVRNGTGFQSLSIQQRLSSALWLRYSGCYVTTMSITGGVGQYLSGSINLIASAESSATTDASTGGILAAPAGGVMNPVGAFGGIFFNETSIGIVDSFTLNLASTGASLEYAMGSASAQGLMQGYLEVTGSIKMYFQNFNLYANFISETQGRLSIICKDTAGNAYVFQLLNAFLSNPKIDASGPNAAIYVTMDLEGNPVATTGLNTLSIDYLPAV